MKPQIGMPNEKTMRYFTRQLYQDFNSPDEAVADQADEAWEAAIRDYGKHLDGFRDRMPTNVVKLSELNLHDAEILSRTEETQPAPPFPQPDFPLPIPLPLWSAVGILSVKLGEEIFSLIYALWDHIRENPAPEDWPFSKRREHWLYDEVDTASQRQELFLHRILLSSGVELEIPFVAVVIHRFAVPSEPEGAENKQSA